jgi:hypothetical protein
MLLKMALLLKSYKPECGEGERISFRSHLLIFLEKSLNKLTIIFNDRFFQFKTVFHLQNHNKHKNI